MGSQEPGQEWLDAYRYQLATMAYAAGATHYHRMPALRSVFKSLLEKLIAKMLRREVWGYWFLTSHSGKFVDPDLEQLRQPWADPIGRENVMVLLRSSPAHGVTVCNAIQRRQVQRRKRAVLQLKPRVLGHGPGNSQPAGFLTRIETSRINVNLGPVAFAVRDLIAAQGADPNSSITVEHARAIAANTAQKPEPPFPRPMFGYILLASSELGEEETLQGLLNHVDRFLKPTWNKGGLDYPVNPSNQTRMGRSEVEPFTGNSAVAYARLNVHGGQRKMWEEPWTPEAVDSVPYVDGVELGSGVDFLRGIWDDECKAMVVSVRSWDGDGQSIPLQFCNLPAGQYGVNINGDLVDTRIVTETRDSIDMVVEAEEKGVDVVILKA
ncbi:hypothetical protein BJY01DRAFT_250568 [Aspergillus pseudoustus]|uniref:Linalool dehydratase/isomerase domain-containing protein n=1 Tax=Aspergillus pseudoustus TaxID=1810923 RepID=A0ABR4JGZ5_9EURO